MGQPELSQVINWLQEAGYRVGKGYPGARMPRIQWPAITVSIHKLDSAAKSRTIAVVVCSPTGQGGNTSEEIAVQITLLLSQHGACCVQEACQYDNWGNYFFVRILATWTEAPEPEPVSGFTAEIGGLTLGWATEFTAEQETLRTPIGAMGQTEPVATLVDSGKWHITLVENFPLGNNGVSSTSEPFTLKIFRGQLREQYSNCHWISIRREDTTAGLRQTRRAIAQERSVTVLE